MELPLTTAQEWRLFFFTSGGVGDVPVHVHVELLLLLLQRVVNGTALLVSLRTAMESC